MTGGARTGSPITMSGSSSPTMAASARSASDSCSSESSLRNCPGASPPNIPATSGSASTGGGGMTGGGTTTGAAMETGATAAMDTERRAGSGMAGFSGRVGRSMS
ncbi:hypothetical protein EJ065_4881 [Corallococcus coralloides]|uniref:Uncharacterized protein n=1 Tax=Corallococcus coralloides TaxID=184914 RepID=A0A410RX20_CORCK|nr:hypothetical protein EJ065_4881 [Corallococcus coralloides]